VPSSHSQVLSFPGMICVMDVGSP